MPQTRLWLHGNIEDNATTSASQAREIGVATLVTGLGTEAVSAVRSAGLEHWVCIGAFSTPKDQPDLHCRSLDGEPVLWFGSGCPNHPEVRRLLMQRVHRSAETGAAGLLLDGIRFASPWEPADAFYTCSCPHCHTAAQALGMDLTAILDDVRRLRDELAAGAALPRLVDGHALAATDALARLLRRPSLAKWLRFRAECTEDVVRQVRAALSDASPRMKLGAYIFTPSLAPLVGQDYGRLGRLLDLVAPMIYRFYDGPACLPGELGGLLRLTGATDRPEAHDGLLALLGLTGTEVAGVPVSVELAVDAVARECLRARTTLGGHAEFLPVLWLDDPLVGHAVEAAMSAVPDGVNFYPTGERRAERLATAAQALAHASRGGG